MIINAFENAFKRMQEKEWDTLYIAVDIHGTVLKPSYFNKETYEAYENALATLRMFKQKCGCFKLIMWTSSTPEQIKMFDKFFKDNEIEFDYINENPEVVAQSTDPTSADFSNKFYFNVGLDDKFGFDPTTDWNKILEWFNNSFKVITKYKK